MGADWLRKLNLDSLSSSSEPKPHESIDSEEYHSLFDFDTETDTVKTERDET